MMQRAVLRAAAIGLLPMLLLFSHAQQKERIRGQQPEQVSSTGAPAASADDAKKDKNEGDPLFKGMKYRAIGPF